MLEPVTAELGTSLQLQELSLLLLVEPEIWKGKH